MDDVVHLGGQHALDVVVHIAQDNAISLGTAACLCGQRLDLQALEDRNGESGSGIVTIAEDGTVKVLCQYHRGRRDEGK